MSSVFQIKRLVIRRSTYRCSTNYFHSSSNSKAIRTSLLSQHNNDNNRVITFPICNNKKGMDLKYFSSNTRDFDDDGDADYKSYKKGSEDEIEDFKKNDDDPLYELKREILKEQRALAKKGQEILKTRKGRLFEDEWDISDEDIMAGPSKFLNVPDWDQSFVSTTALDKVHVLKTVPTIEELATTQGYDNLLPMGIPHPSYDRETYVSISKQREYDRIYKTVSSIASTKVKHILQITNVSEQQNEIDELFEYVEKQLMELEGVRLGNKKIFGDIVEKALEQYLDYFNNEEKRKWEEKIAADLKAESEKKEEGDNNELLSFIEEKDSSVSDSNIDDDDDNEIIPSNKTIPSDKALFINLKNENKFHETGYAGHIQEDFDLAAANETSNNILLRSITHQVAKCIIDNKTHIYLHGRNGAGKSVCMNTIVACIRNDPKYICLFFPNADKITQHFDYLVPSKKKEKYYDLPNLSKGACEQLLNMHGDQLDALEIVSDEAKDLLKQYFTDEQLEELNYLNQDKLTVQHITQTGSENSEHSSQCYSYIVDYLTNHQKKYKFIFVVDEYNMYHWRSQYYHESWDEDVRYAIPFYRMNLLEPFINPLKYDTKNENLTIITSVSHSRPVSNERTKQLTETTIKTKKNVTVLEVPRYSKEEHEAIVAHYECVGLGKLCFDKGKVLNDCHEMNFLYMVSGSIGRHLLNACIM